MMFPPQFIDRIRDVLSTSEIVGKRVVLKNKGREWHGLCPFHNEKTPSFTVNDDKGFYHCFGCGAHGNIFDFVMRTEGLNFPETIEKLGLEAGLELPKPDKFQAEKYDKLAKLMRCAGEAANWFQHNLKTTIGAEARNYLQKRGLTAETIEKFKLGYAPNSKGDLQRHLASKGYTLTEMQAIGVIKNDYEYFRGRVIFPITNVKGEVIAFGGRILGEGEPKYLNSPETEIFKKRSTLYGKAIARKNVYDSGELIITEGYMDVISLNQAGFNNAVAPLGTSVSNEHLLEMWKMADTPTLCLDGDNAGTKAMLRVANLATPMLTAGKSLKFVTLPNGQDPDDVARKSPANFRSLLTQAKPLADVVYDAEKDSIGVETPEQRAALKKQLDSIASKIPDAGVAKEYAKFFNDKLWQEGRQKNFVKSKKGGTKQENSKASAQISSIINLSPDNEKLDSLLFCMLGTILAYPTLLEEAEIEEFFVTLESKNQDIEQILQIIINNSANPQEITRLLGNYVNNPTDKSGHKLRAFAKTAEKSPKKEAWNNVYAEYQQHITIAEYENSDVFCEDSFAKLQEQHRQLSENKQKLNENYSD
jgi:DNA primase